MKRVLLAVTTLALISLMTLVSFALPETIDVKLGVAPTIDGVISAKEWNDAGKIEFLTEGGNCTVYFKHNGSVLHVAFKVPNKDSSSGVQIFVDTNYDQASAPQTDDYRFTIALRSPPDDYGENQGTGAGWTAWGPPVGWTGKYQVFTNAWNAEFAIPFTKLGITAGIAKTIGISFYNAWTSTGDYRWPTGGDWMDPSTWEAASSLDNWGPSIVDVTRGCTPIINGVVSSGEWTDANSVTFATSGGICTVYIKHSRATLYVAFDVPNLDATSGVQVFVDTNYDRASAPQTDDYRFTIARRLPPDDYGENQGTGAGWTAWGPPVGWTGKYQDLISAWNAEFAIPFSKLGITAGEPKTIGIAFCNCWAASDYYWPSGADWMDPSTWGAAYSSDYWSSSVGGVQIPIDKLALLVPYIFLTSAAAAAALGSMFAGKRWIRNVAV